MIEFFRHHELVYVAFVCTIILAIVAGGYVFMFLLIMKNDQKERKYRDQHNWKHTLIPHKYKDQQDD